jgi:nucleoside-diphosphate-sugar epimerase
VHARDVATALVLAGSSRRAANTIFNLAGPEVVTEGDVLRELWLGRRGFDGRDALDHEDGHQHQALKYSIDRAEALLRFTPAVTLREGLREVLDGMSYGGALRNGRRAWAAAR